MISTSARDQSFDIGIVTLLIVQLTVYTKNKYFNLFILLHFVFMSSGNLTLLIGYVMGAFGYWRSDESVGRK